MNANVKINENLLWQRAISSMAGIVILMIFYENFKYKVNIIFSTSVMLSGIMLCIMLLIACSGLLYIYIKH